MSRTSWLKNVMVKSLSRGNEILRIFTTALEPNARVGWTARVSEGRQASGCLVRAGLGGIQCEVI